MARTATLTVLIADTRKAADMEGSTFVSDSEITRYLNQSATELYDLLVEKSADYYVTSGTVSVVAGTSTYALPASFYKLLSAEVPLGGEMSYIMQPFAWAHRHLYGEAGWGCGPVAYQLRGGNITFVPEPDAAYTVTVWYIPAFTDLSAGSDTLDGVNGWEEYVTLDAAIKCLRKEESDVSLLMAQKEMLRERIIRNAHRDQGEPHRIIDVTGRNARAW